MKSSPIRVVVIAVTSSVATVAAVELLREARPVSQPAVAVGQPVAARAPDAEPLVPAPRAPDPPADYEQRLAELERRLAALELASSRQPASTTSAREKVPAEDELRERVLRWVAEDREALGRSTELEAEAKRRTEREWDARYGAHLFALEHHLAKWQEEKFAELYLAIKERELEIEAGIDMSSDDPGEIEARFVEFDEWCEQREREVTLLMDPELYREMYGQD